MMKNLKVLFFTFLSCMIIFSSCSSDDDNNEVKSSAKSILEFTINSVKATIDETKKTISITLPHGTDKTKLTPTIKISEKASINPKSAIETDFSLDKKYTVTAEDGSTQDYTVTVKVAEKTDREITSFSFEDLSPAVNGELNQIARTVILTVPFGTNITALKPTIAHSGKEISPASNTPQDFTSSIKYTVTAANGKLKIIW